jgi:hypothetical protein
MKDMRKQAQALSAQLICSAIMRERAEYKRVRTQMKSWEAAFAVPGRDTITIKRPHKFSIKQGAR